jgi:hypothetical protein
MHSFREAVFEDRSSRAVGDLTADEAELRNLEYKGSNRSGRTQKSSHMPKSSIMSSTGTAAQVWDVHTLLSGLYACHWGRAIPHVCFLK